MDVKLTGGLSHDSLTDELLNPFVHHLELDSAYEKIKTAVFTVILVPVRVSIICFLLISGWFLACIGLWGLTEEDLREKPLAGWRRKLVPLLCFLGKSTYRAGGMTLVIKGKQVSRKEAPILVIAPHSTFLDGGIVYATGFPSIIVRRESGANPYIGKLINFTQPVYVWRDDFDSRQNTIKEIIHRATSDLDWPQILIFPEGTCTNRSCLITFKPGAFYPGVPIQPVCIRYPNKLDTVTWTWEGPSALKLLWLTLSQPYSYCEIEFLPVYTPSNDEKRDPKLFANNVRRVMAKALGVPVSDYTYGDCKIMAKAKEMNLPNASVLVEVQKLRQKLNMDKTNPEEVLVYSSDHCKNSCALTFTSFCILLKLNPTDPTVQHLFKLYDKNSSGVIDFREYLIGAIATSSHNKSKLEIVRLGCKIYDSSNIGRLNIWDFALALHHTLAVSEEYAMEIFRQVDKNKLDYITFEHFEAYAEKKAEFAHLFSFTIDEPFIKKNGFICPDDSAKKVD